MRGCFHLKNGTTLFLASKLYYLCFLLENQKITEPDCIDQTLAYIHAKFNTDITINDLADKFGYNRSYFSALFTKKVGISPQKYIFKLRMETAANLMLKYQKPPAIAARAAGYDDLSLFSKMFKKHFGISPRQYIEQHKDK